MIDKRLWFYEDDSEICKEHREAYEKSLNCNDAVKVRNGIYYYKGWNVSRMPKNQWSYEKAPFHSDWFEVCHSKAEAMTFIDEIIEFENNNKEE